MRHGVFVALRYSFCFRVGNIFYAKAQNRKECKKELKVQTKAREQETWQFELQRHVAGNTLCVMASSLLCVIFFVFGVGNIFYAKAQNRKECKKELKVQTKVGEQESWQFELQRHVAGNTLYVMASSLLYVILFVFGLETVFAQRRKEGKKD